MRAAYLAGGLAALMLASSNGAQAADLYAAFQKLCVAHNADPKAALADADADGWITVNPGQMPMPDSPTFKFGDYSVRAKVGADGATALVAGGGTIIANDTSVPSNICIVLTKPADVTAAAKLKTWAGVEPIPMQASNNAQLYVFEATAGGHKPLTAAPADAAAAAASGHLAMAMSSDTPSGFSLLGYLVSR
jgi:hypothetical protein